MFDSADIRGLIDLNKDSSKCYTIVSAIFGKPGDKKPAPVYFSNLTIEGYKEITQWLKYLMKLHENIINRESIINQFTEIRQQTAIDENKGVAKEHSLRTIRVLKKGLTFEGTIDMEEENREWLMLLFFACKNLRYIGTKRNRGFGKVRCELYENQKEINFLNELEELCKPLDTV